MRLLNITCKSPRCARKVILFGIFPVISVPSVVNAWARGVEDSARALSTHTPYLTLKKPNTYNPISPTHTPSLSLFHFLSFGAHEHIPSTRKLHLPCLTVLYLQITITYIKGPSGEKINALFYASPMISIVFDAANTAPCFLQWLVRLLCLHHPDSRISVTLTG